MKIVKEDKTAVEFIKIDNGGVFSHSGIFYIKTEGIEDSNYNAINAVDLSDGEITSFEDNDLVTSYPNAALVINKTVKEK